MAGEKLYPPTINGTLPAFYSEQTQNNGTVATITVPFSMNRAVDASQVGGFSLKIKTIQSNTFLGTLTSIAVGESINNGKIIFSVGNDILDKIKEGQFLKAQLAYLSIQEEQGQKVPGYYSTIGIIKYTSKPKVYIDGFKENPERIRAFTYNYTGVYEPSTDKSERPYSYNFSLYNRYNELVETSGWLLHNTNINNVASESLSLDRTIDNYSFNVQVIPDQEYFLQYSVKTINGLEIKSDKYICLEPHIIPSNFFVDLNAENIFEEGYVKVFLTLQEGKTLTNTPALQNPIAIEISRAEQINNFSTWTTFQKIYFYSYEEALNWSFKDFSIEQGITYKYCFRQYNNSGIWTERCFSNEVYADFEDMFLWDGIKQVKIRFNPKVSSFKINHLEQKIDTIGSRYPIIFRNGIVDYKEFPISGLISYYMDNNELFVNYQKDLNIISSSWASRLNKATPVNQSLNDTDMGKSWEISNTLDSLGYNMQAERKFKLKLLEWLGNGEIKLFKSPAEGNYFVRLLNISLSPEDKTGRMIHNFSCTAYEVAEFNNNNLIDLGFIKSEKIVLNSTETKTVLLSDIIHNFLYEDKTDNNPRTLTHLDFYQGIKINDEDIFEYCKIDKSNNSSGEKVYINIGIGEDSKTEIVNTYTLNVKNNFLPDLYFCFTDYNIFNDNDEINEKINKIKAFKNIIGDTQITYTYQRTIIPEVDSLDGIKDVYLVNKVETVPNTSSKPFLFEDLNREIIKFYSITFKKKKGGQLIYENNKYIDENGNVIKPVEDTDLLSFYWLEGSGNFITIYYKNTENGNITINSVPSYSLYGIKLIKLDDQLETIAYPDILVKLQNIDWNLYQGFQLDPSIYAELAYLEKVTEYEEETT